jgi:peptidoglycan hydrolase CwlO-like protein
LIRTHPFKTFFITIKSKKMATTLADLQTEVSQEDTVIDSALALISGLAAQVAALQPNQAAIDALAADIKAKSDSLAAAVTANTPAAPAA